MFGTGGRAVGPERCKGFVASEDIERLAARGGWLDAYRDIRAAGIDIKPNQAAFAAWMAQTKSERRPKTKAELAQALGYASEQVFYRWQHKSWYKALVRAIRAARIIELQQKADDKLDGLLDSADEQIVVRAIKLAYDEARHQEGLAVESDLEREWWDAAGSGDD